MVRAGRNLGGRRTEEGQSIQDLQHQAGTSGAARAQPHLLLPIHGPAKERDRSQHTRQHEDTGHDCQSEDGNRQDPHCAH